MVLVVLFNLFRYEQKEWEENGGNISSYVPVAFYGPTKDPG